MDDAESGGIQHTQAELHAFNQAYYGTASVRMANIDNPAVQSSIATLTTIPVSRRTTPLSKIPAEIILRDLRLDATTPLSALAGSPIEWKPRILLEVALHYRSHTIASFTRLREEQIRRNVRHAAKWHGKMIKCSTAEVLALHYEYRSRHARACKDPDIVRCCTAEQGILKVTNKNKKPTSKGTNNAPKELMDGLTGLGVADDGDQKTEEDADAVAEENAAEVEEEDAAEVQEEEDHDEAMEGY
jgi:hypothetical protein